jgi:Family of unknown function (DUF6282)
MGAVDNLLTGAVDLHCHSGPSPMPRRITHAEAARQADEAGFRAIVAKCHYHDTTTDILSMAPLLDWINLIGPERTSLGSDLGQVNNPLPIEAYKQVVGNLLDSGVKEKDIQLMIRDNPARLIGLD